MQTATGTAAPAAPAARQLRLGASSHAAPRRGLRWRWRLDGFDLCLLIAFAALSCWVLGLDLYYSISRGLVWTGTDGVFISDQLQYLSWIRSASEHFLIADSYVLHHTAADYLQPAVVISAGLTLAGVAPWLALLLWKPVAVIASFSAIRAYAHRSLKQRWQRHAALALGLFYGSFTLLYGHWTVIGDMFPGFLSWGYPFSLLALAAVIYALLSYERARGAGRITLVPALLAILAGLMHPWNDETFAVIVLGSELAALRAGRPDRPRLKLALITLAGAAVPLLYFMALGRFDPMWALARKTSRHSWPLGPTLLVIAPAAPLAALGYLRGGRGTWWTMIRLWPAATLLIYGISESSAFATPLHAWQGITVPLGVLSAAGAGEVRGWLARARARGRLGAGGVRAAALAGWLALALACVPASADELATAPSFMRPQPFNPNFIKPSENAALRYLAADRTRGGVLTRYYLGELVPERTGRRSYAGDCMWSQPGCVWRNRHVRNLLDGHMRPVKARAFVAGTGARFLLADCGSSPALGRLLGPLVVSTRRFGCAAVYQLR
jgi:hypothetical protein